MNTLKVKILEDTFNKGFELVQFRKFANEFFNELEMFGEKRSTGIWKEYTEHISAYYKVAKYEEEENRLIVLAVELKKGISVERARSMQRSFISKVLDENNFEAAIVAFYSPDEENWRLSFVRLDYTFKEKGLELDLTPAKRYSYLVGKGEPNHTAKKQLLPIFENDQANPSLDEIEQAFTVEKVTKDFFEQYKEKYIQLKEYLENDPSFISETNALGLEVEKFSEQFSKKLLGQLAFLYFLQKKGWLGVRLLPEDRSLSESDYQKTYHNYTDAHRKVLEKVFEKSDVGKRKISAQKLIELNDHEAELFSDCFVGTEHEQRWGNGDKQFISKLYQTCKSRKSRNNFFNDFLQPLFYEALNKKRKNQYFHKFNCKIPFLNGGLFEPLEGYHWRDVNFNIPNALFSNQDEKKREADGILDIFERYNFTMNEDEPLEVEVAVDPEMLGKIFENLLDVTDRKSKGAFYTPREIVHYMCQESLANYITNEVDVPYEDIREFIEYGELIRDEDSRAGVGYKKGLRIKPSIYKNIVKIDTALQNVKVADPAVGSGAFPLGMLSEIVRARNNITDYFVKLDREGTFSRKIGENVIRKNRSPFKLKWKTIKNSIFAVDIEPSAIDIAKLRLWLSVVVDQEINDDTPEPHPLPNLDMNIMVGNSLIDEYEGIKLFDEEILNKEKSMLKEDENDYITVTEQISFLVDHSDETLNDMFKMQDQYFSAEDEQLKKELKIRIDQLRDELIEYKLDREGNSDGIRKYTELKKKKQKPYFLWYLEFAKVFREQGGFDIVIGNPPYAAKFNKKERNFLEAKYPNVPDYESSNYFTCKSLDLLRENGIMSYIIPNMILSNHFAQKFRLELLEDWRILKVDNLSEINIFETATVRNCIFTFEKKKVENFECKFINADLKNNTYFSKKEKFFNKNFLIENAGNWMNLLYQDESTIIILNKIKSESILLSEIANVSQGLIPYDKYRGHSEETIKNRIWHSKLQIDDSYKRELKGKDVKRYELNWSGGNWIKYGEWLAAPRKPEYFNNPRILIREITNPRILATYTDEEYYNTPSIINIININIHPYYLLGVINSTLMSFYHVQTSPKAKKGLFPKILVNDVRKLPIKLGDENQQDEMIKLVGHLIRAYQSENKKTEETDKYEQMIDNLVFRMYKLTEEEINLILID